MTKNQTVTSKEAAALLQVSLPTIKLYCRQGLLAGAHKIQAPRGEVWVIPTKSLANFNRPRRGRRVRA